MDKGGKGRISSGPLKYVNYFEKHAAGTESNFAVGIVRVGYSAGWIIDWKRSAREISTED